MYDNNKWRKKLKFLCILLQIGFSLGLMKEGRTFKSCNYRSKEDPISCLSLLFWRLWTMWLSSYPTYKSSHLFFLYWFKIYYYVLFTGANLFDLLNCLWFKMVWYHSTGLQISPNMYMCRELNWFFFMKVIRRHDISNMLQHQRCVFEQKPFSQWILTP